jgi:hypothetical protein
MENVFFHPHVGKNYETTGFNGLKLLILGESHYCEYKCENCGKIHNKECAGFTIEVLTRFFKYKEGKVEFEDWMRTFTRFTNVLLEEEADNQTLLNFWDSVIFYNYVQSSTEGSRISPTDKQFEESKKAFLEILEYFKPDLILVWGKRLWDHMPDCGFWGKEDILDNFNDHFYYYEASGKKIPAYRIYHPSSQYFNYESSKYIKEAIRLSNPN